MRALRAVAITGLVCLPGLTGCFSSVRRVPQVQTVGVTRSADVRELVAQMQGRDAAIRTLNSSVLITASTGGGREGKVKTYTSFRGYIFVRKPRDLRVILQLPLIGSRALDMVSDGKTFTLVHATAHSGDVWVQGTNEVTKPSANGLENLRPAVFLDSLLVPGVGDQEFVELTDSTREVEPAHGHKAAVEEADYDLEVSKVTEGHTLQRERVVHISRTTMLPYQQDIYDAQGRIVTQATYENYAPAGPEVQFPHLITITRPLDEYSLKVEVTKLTLNGELENDQFELHIPAGAKVQRLD